MTLFVDEHSSRAEIEGILAPEIAHAHLYLALGPGTGGDRLLTEGLAS
ncbi:MAG: hypothetical protein R3300_13130 [Candidatus Promineifilaceae bacterium]|nr:hypothetical protein [Candidatus Promineifilaceae bacterium]